MIEPFLQLSRVSKSFMGVYALKGIDLSIDLGKTYCLVGENGSGKSTLIKLIAGVHAPDSGDIRVHGKSYRRLRPIEAIRAGVQVIYQDFSLFPNLTVAENVAMNYEISHNHVLVNWKEINTIARGALKRINLELDLDAVVGSLPVAVRQLIAIAKALLQDARLMIMDEATTALTRMEISALFGIIEDLKHEGIATLFVSHKLDEVLEIADQIIIVRNGEKVMDREARGMSRMVMIQAMTGRTLAPDDTRIAPLQPNAPLLLEVGRMSRTGSFADISFDLRAGEVIGITGLLGSGRTSLALCLFGMLPPDSGSVRMQGRPTRLRTVQDALRSGIGYVPEDRLTEGLFLTQPIGKNIVARVIDRLVGRTRLIDETRVRAAVTEWIDRLRIQTPSASLPVSSLSGGNQQRVVLAKWLAGNPKVLILNGPTVGVDVGSKAEIYDIIRGLAEGGMGLIVISDDVPELLQVCHRVLLMKQGHLAEEVRRDDITEAQLNAMLVSA